MATQLRHRDQRGFALVLALAVLFVLTLLGTLLMASVAIERKSAGHDLRSIQSLDVAEAGINEVCSRIMNGDITLDPADPRATGQIFLTTAGNVPVVGPETTAVETKQAAGQWLNYSTPDKGPHVLTVNWKTDPAQTVVYRYDPSRPPPTINTSTGNPIYIVHSTGTTGTAAQAILAEICSKPFNATVKGAFAANQGIDFSGTSDVCGDNHSINTPIGTAINACDAYRVGFGNMPGGWSTGTITQQGSTTEQGTPSITQNNVGFYSGPWDAFGMTEPDFLSWIGSPQALAPANPKGLIYLDNDGITQNQSGGYAYQGGNGEGLLYVDGDLHINGNFTFKGMIYVEGNLDINGTCWILGGIIVRGKSRLGIANGTFTCLYSSDAISQEISKYGGQFTRLSWREVP
jgi:Tfp pilus assembly protein PilX